MNLQKNTMLLSSVLVAVSLVFMSSAQAQVPYCTFKWSRFGLGPKIILTKHNSLSVHYKLENLVMTCTPAGVDARGKARYGCSVGTFLGGFFGGSAGIATLDSANSLTWVYEYITRFEHGSGMASIEDRVVTSTNTCRFER